MKTKKEKNVPKLNRCGECERPCWNSENRDFKGRVFIGRCKYSKFGRVTNEGGVVYVDTPACEQFERKERL